ncbi:MAG: hypothetical protein PHD82_16635 [Candidatus Riflebacteria bacterium]|nr:hypothetical protein [Candidatus Riflebacteria bacterium]
MHEKSPIVRESPLKTPLKKNRSGMAIMVVLSIASILLLLGVAYLKSFSQSTVTGKLQLDQIQSEFFARGLQNIALFKIKRYPDFFLRSYRHMVYHRRIAAGEGGLEPPLVPAPNPMPFTKFTGIYPGNPRDLLNHLPDGIDTATGFSEPLDIATWSTQFSLLSAEDFNRGFIEIVVNLQLEGKATVNTYRMSLDASQTARL